MDWQNCLELFDIFFNCLNPGDRKEGAQEVGEEHDADCDAKSQVKVFKEDHIHGILNV